MARDPLTILAKLRRIEVAAAQRRVAEAHAALLRARDDAASAQATLRTEQPEAVPTAYGSFLRRALAEREARAAVAARAGATLDAERAELAHRRREEKTLDLLRGRRAAAARRMADRRAQALVDECASQGRSGA